MKENRDIVLEWMGVSEGGYVNHPDDPGGATKYGVTQRTLDAWRALHGQPRMNVRDISKDMANEIFVAEYLAPVRFDDLPAGLDYAMADFSVNSGPSRAVRTLQEALTHLDPVSVDGNMGPQTLSAAQRANTPDLVVKLCERRMEFLRRLRHFKTFGKGWTRRVMGEQAGVQNADTGVIDRGVRMAKGQATPVGPKPAPGKATGDPVAGIGALIQIVLNLFASVFGGRKDA